MKKRALRKLSIFMASILSFSILGSFSPINAHAYGKDEPIIVVSMGDSFSSGEGIEPFYGQKENDDPDGKDLSRSDKINNDDWLAHRSMYSWPSLLKVGNKAVREHKMPLKSNGASEGDSEMQWYFVAASGAVIWNIGGKNDDGSWWGEYYHETKTNVGTAMYPIYDTKSKNLDPQLKVFEDNNLYGKVDYVTMSIGGNDLDFVPIVETSIKDTVIADLANKSNSALSYALFDAVKVPYIQSPGFIGKRIKKSWDKWNNFWIDKEGKKQKPVKESLIDAYHRTIDFAGPQADIIVAGYPELYYRETDTPTANKIQREIIDNFIIKMCKPDGEIKKVIDKCNKEFANGKIHYVSVIDEFKDKGMNAPGEQWIENINLRGSEKLDESLKGIIGYSSAHPNKTGAEHYAKLVNEKIEELEKIKKDSHSQVDKTALEYAEIVRSLIKDYGRASIVENNSAQLKPYQLKGLCYANIMDFDDDGTDELICVYGPTTNGNGFDTPYYMKVYGYDGKNVQTLFEHSAFYFNDRFTYSIAYCEENNGILLLTRKNPQTYDIYEWSRLTNNGFEVVKSFSDFDEQNPGVVCKIDGAKVSREEFNKQLNEYKNKQTYVNFADDSKSSLEETINITNDTLELLGIT